MTAPQVSAILVNYNAGRELAVALQSIADDLAGRPWEAVIVDNASSDGSAEPSTAFAPYARVVRNRGNVGFARGVNQGLGATSAPTVLIMNPDCRLAQGAIDVLSGELERSERVRLVGPRILNPDGSVQGSARGDPDMLTGLFGRSTALRRALPEPRRSQSATSSPTRPSAAASRLTGSPARACWRAAALSSASTDSTNATFCTGKTPTCAGGCAGRATRSATCRRRPLFTASAIPAAMCGRQRSARSTRARISITRRSRPDGVRQAARGEGAAGRALLAQAAAVTSLPQIAARSLRQWPGRP